MAIKVSPCGQRFEQRSRRRRLVVTVAIMIPEASTQLEHALRQAEARRARVSALCDTAAQVDQVAAEVARLLPEHRRVSIARAAAGGWALQ